MPKEQRNHTLDKARNQYLARKEKSTSPEKYGFPFLLIFVLSTWRKSTVILVIEARNKSMVLFILQGAEEFSLLKSLLFCSFYLAVVDGDFRSPLAAVF